MDKYLDGWRNLTEVNIPPIDKNYKQSNIVIREKVPVQEKKKESAGTFILDSVQGTDTNKTVILLQKKKNYGKIVRLRTQEEIVLTLESGVIGQAEDADYKIEGNRAISRHHAKIFAENGSVYLEDLNSSNHSWVNDELVTDAVELPDQSIIKLADEEFQFYTG